MNTQIASFQTKDMANKFMKTVKVISVQVTSVVVSERANKVMNQYFITYEEVAK